ncbi:MAG: hypothetical protein O7F74_08070, partial [Bacteroidetes bacterium]|nr:hypothetical protein [Bacteroidota bacterium]
WDKPRKEQGCESKNTFEVLERMEDILRRNAHKKVIVVGHHPIYTYGPHGGYFTFRQHLFPLTDANKSLYIPLPIIGSIYPLYRRYIGNIQDIHHPKYKAIRKLMIEAFEKYPNVIHASGHEHSLQYSTNNDIHYIVSGAGVKTTDVKKKEYARFAQSQVGFARLDFYKDGRVDMQFITPDGGDGKVLFEKELMRKPFVPPVSGEEFAQRYDHLKDSVVTTSASQQYLIKTGKHWLLGKNYRQVWAADRTVPVFDIGSEHGGLKIIQRGGGFQTNSLRLEASDGKQYVLRSIEKYAIKAVPPALQETFAAGLVQDQISASHPYGAFVVPTMAEAAGVYHTNPMAVFVPDDPRLGPYRDDFANTMCLYEERPAGDASDLPNFGNSKDIISTAKMLKKLHKDNDNYVDQDWVLKSRMFDLLIGDWDRHDDQWRWASFDQGKRTMFRPIPRDRDQIFFINNGLLMGIAKRKWALPKFQGFDYDLKNTPGFMYNARWFDRDFLNQPDREDWMSIVEELQTNMTDEVIESAIREWPDPIYDLRGEEITNKLKTRRQNLKRFALQHYLFLSKEVTVHGSHKRELFKVERLDDENTRVQMYKISKKKDREKLLYERTFKTSETKDIRLFGLDGDDEFEISGSVKKGPRVRVIGGEGEDKITDDSKVAGIKKKTHVYDTKEGNILQLGSESRDRTSKDPEVNHYNRQEFEYDVVAPLFIAGYNTDDGFTVGAGTFAMVHGFRKDPFRSSHFVFGSLGTNTISWDFKYKGRFTGVFGKWDVLFNLDALAPSFTSNFFGFGNDSQYIQNIDQVTNVDVAIDYYRTQFTLYSTETILSRRLGKKAEFGFGFHWQGFEAEDEYDGEDRFILDFSDTLSSNFFKFKTYTGGILQFSYDTRNNPAMPLSGVYFETDLRGYTGNNNASEDYTRFLGSLSLYQTIRLPAPLTLAIRVGAGHNFGNYEFYQAQILNGVRNFNVRGYRKTRFFGDTKFYSNNELRLQISQIRNPVVPFTFGLTGFYDIGRVWFEGENSDTWHDGYGGGIWLAPLNLIPLSFELAQSDEGSQFYFRLGYLF